MESGAMALNLIERDFTLPPPADVTRMNTRKVHPDDLTRLPIASYKICHSALPLSPYSCIALCPSICSPQAVLSSAIPPVGGARSRWGHPQGFLSQCTSAIR